MPGDDDNLETAKAPIGRSESVNSVASPSNERRWPVETSSSILRWSLSAWYGGWFGFLVLSLSGATCAYPYFSCFLFLFSGPTVVAVYAVVLDLPLLWLLRFLLAASSVAIVLWYRFCRGEQYERWIEFWGRFRLQGLFFLYFFYLVQRAL